MVTVVATCTCTKCGDVFEVNSKEFTNCKNGCCSVRVEEFGSSYMTTNDMSKCYKIQDEQKFYDPNDYVELDDKCLELISYFENLHQKWGDPISYTHIYISTDRNTDGTKYIDRININFETRSNDYYEQNIFSTSISCMRSYGNTTDKVYYKLKRMKNLYEAIMSNKLDVSTKNRKQLKELFDWERKQLERYDYEFCI